LISDRLQESLRIPQRVREAYRLHGKISENPMTIYLFLSQELAPSQTKKELMQFWMRLTRSHVIMKTIAALSGWNDDTISWIVFRILCVSLCSFSPKRQTDINRS
jgi:hypothetical protein